jgi:hypothetical protein
MSTSMSCARAHVLHALVAVVVAALLLPAPFAEAKRNKRPGGGNSRGAAASGPSFEGRLEAGDLTLDSGEFFDVHTFDVQSGQSVSVTLTSRQFDTYLAVISPGGTPYRNDDFENRKDMSRVDLTADESGTWVISVTTYKPGETGNYDVAVEIGGAAAKAPTAGGNQQFDGTLQAGDLTLESGEYFDVHTFDVQSGQTFSVTLTSSQFDTYLAVISPGGTPHRNDDFDSRKDMSRVDVTADESGTWVISVTTYKPGETGSYHVAVELGAAVAPPSAGGGSQTFTGTLQAGDETLDGGEFFDVHAFTAQGGQNVVVELTSNQFDTFIAVFPPSGEPARNDDHEGRKDMSRLEFVAEQSGSYQVAVTSYKAGETGAYSLTVGVGAAAAPVAGDNATQRFSGALAPGDVTLESGEFVDSYAIQGRAGQFVVVDLRATEFDPWVGLRAPSGETWENDDHEGSSTRSQVARELTEDGEYQVLVTSYKPGAAGAYDVVVQFGSGGSASPAASGGPRVEQGRLEDGDMTISTGEYADGYEIQGRPGQEVRIDLQSSEFDAYLFLIPPGNGSPIENDEAPGQPDHAVIETTLSELGTYVVAVTSFKPGETGAYTLTIDQTGAGGTEAQRDVTTLASGRSVGGTLEDGDDTIASGEYIDWYVFDGEVGQTFKVELTATDFDPYVGVHLPDGEVIENDDYNNRRDMAGMDFTLQQSGRYKIAATSYQAGEVGSYQLQITLGGGGSGTTPVRPTGSGGQVHGVFVGISDYPGEEADLRYTADDARNLQAAFSRGVGMAAGNSVVLTDAEATVEGVRQAMSRIGGAAGPDDLFVFFYSGHGSRQKRADFQQSDPDGLDETLMLFDGHVTDDAFAGWLDGIHAGTSLVILDACFSGGFSKDIICVPGRMGMFSSEEDVTSSLADKFLAGGYLAQFVADGVGDGLADNGDGQLTALELCQYVHERYRADVKSGGSGVSEIVMTGRVHGFQHLVVDRGSIGPYQVLFSVGK